MRINSSLSAKTRALLRGEKHSSIKNMRVRIWHVKHKTTNENSRREKTQHSAWCAKLKLPSPHQHVSQSSIYYYKVVILNVNKKIALILLVLLMLTGWCRRSNE